MYIFLFYYIHIYIYIHICTNYPPHKNDQLKFVRSNWDKGVDNSITPLPFFSKRNTYCWNQNLPHGFFTRDISS